MDDLDVVTLSEIEHYAYCRRQWALIHLDQVWEDNTPTAIGHIVHRRVDHAQTRVERGHVTTRSLIVWSDVHGLYGRADSVEFMDGSPPLPVEHKSGKHALRPAVLQLAAQAICLEEMFGEAIGRGAVWLHGQRRREDVSLTDAVKRNSLEIARDIRTTRGATGLPEATFDTRCPECSLINECLPRFVGDRRRALALHRGLYDLGPSPRS